MSWRRNFADYQNALSQKSADKLMEEFKELYQQAADEIIPMFMDVYQEACSTTGIKNLTPGTLFHLDSYWTLLNDSKQRVEVLGNIIISLMNNQFHVMYVDVFEGIAPGNIQIPCFIDPEEIQRAIDGNWGVDKKNWRERVWIKMTVLWDRLTGALMEAIIKHRTEEKLQATLQKEFEESRKSLNSTIMIDVTRIQSKAAKEKQLTIGKMVNNASINTAAYIMSYGDESEINALSAENISEVNALSNVVRANNNTVVRALSSRRGGGGGSDWKITIVWVTENDDRVCEACALLDGNTWVCNEEESEALESMLPLHPNCRCILDFASIDLGEMDIDSAVDDVQNAMEQGEAIRNAAESRRNEVFAKTGWWKSFNWE